MSNKSVVILIITFIMLPFNITSNLPTNSNVYKLISHHNHISGVEHNLKQIGVNTEAVNLEEIKFYKIEDFNNKALLELLNSYNLQNFPLKELEYYYSFKYCTGKLKSKKDIILLIQEDAEFYNKLMVKLKKVYAYSPSEFNVKVDINTDPKKVMYDNYKQYLEKETQKQKQKERQTLLENLENQRAEAIEKLEKDYQNKGDILQ